MYTNILCTKRMLYMYFRRPFFSGIELYVSYDWWATAPNTHHSLISIHQFARISSITWKPQGACNSTTHLTTPLLPSMLRFMLKVAKQLQLTSYGPMQTSLPCYLCAIKNDNKTLVTYDCSTHQTTASLQECISVQVHSKVRLTSFHPDIIPLQLWCLCK